MPASDDAVALALAACEAADAKQAQDLLVLEVADVLTLVDVFVLASARNDRQLKAVVDQVQEQLREGQARKPLRREGDPSSGWVVLDYGDLVCHLFDVEQRELYGLERLWGDVPHRDPFTGEVTSHGVLAEAAWSS